MRAAPCVTERCRSGSVIVGIPLFQRDALARGVAPVETRDREKPLALGVDGKAHNPRHWRAQTQAEVIGRRQIGGGDGQFLLGLCDFAPRHSGGQLRGCLRALRYGWNSARSAGR